MFDVKERVRKGIPSYCTGDEIVIESLIRLYKKNKSTLLIESTANQVNQFGGYTGKTPKQFIDEVRNIAEQYKLGANQLIFGGDHLGPLVWKNLDEKNAMILACELVKEYVMAGFKKIHLDTSMPLGNEEGIDHLSNEIIAKRGLLLYQECKKVDINNECIYVIGSEVPAPGGETFVKKLSTTSIKDVKDTINTYKNVFNCNGIDRSEFNDKIIGLVVHPGIEFTKDKIIEYKPNNTIELSKVDKDLLVYEGHSTDFQKREALNELVRDGFKILKVGPELTYNLRTTLDYLEYVENKIFDKDLCSNFSSVLKDEMLKDNTFWVNYYKNANKHDFDCSYLDRSRYYMHTKRVAECIKILKRNINNIKQPSIINKYISYFYNVTGDDNLFNQIIDCSIEKVVNKYESAFRK